MNTKTSTAQAEQSRTTYADGSCHGNPGPGGWATVAYFPDGTSRERSGHIPGKTTNNIAELMAAIEALKDTPEGGAVVVKTDSVYVVNGFNQWLQNWLIKGFRNAKKKPVANRELWEKLNDLAGTRKVTFEHVRGHQGIEGNERADALAYSAALGEVVGNE